MNIAILQRQARPDFSPQLILPEEYHSTMEGWLSGDSRHNNIAPLMYVGDADDHRWKKGHSSAAYYVKKDEAATRQIVYREIQGSYKNFYDLGVGGETAVRLALELAESRGATYYGSCDMAPALAHGGAEIAKQSGLKSEALIFDIFGEVPFKKPNSFIALLGLTIGNLETYDNLPDLKDRLVGIWKNYAKAVTGRQVANQQESKLLISYDANMNIDEVVACYDNEEMAELIRSGPGRFIDTSNLKYEVRTTVLRSEEDETHKVLFVSLGLVAEKTHFIEFNGKQFLIEEGQFMPVINTARFSIPFMTDTVELAGWRPENRWSATDRVQYQEFAL